MKKRFGFYIVPALVILNIIVWLVFPPLDDGRADFARTYLGEVIGSTVIILMSYSLFLSTRPKWAEQYYGGLGKMYRVHRKSSLSAFILLFVHLIIVPISFSDFRPGNYLAVIAFTGIVSIVLITLAPFGLASESYQGWKKLHRFIGIFFVVGFIHALTVDSLEAPIPIAWVLVFFVIGVLSYLYTELFGRFFGKYLPYTVEVVRHPTSATTEVTLRTKGDPIKLHKAGQFLFVRFPGIKGLNESHPFSISSAPSEDVLRLTIKASGDFTQKLSEELAVGADAIVEGPYGMFDYKSGGKKQIWIAGGVGVTPFLSFIRDLDGDLDRTIKFYYSVRVPEEVLFAEELKSAAEVNLGLDLTIRYTAEEDHLAFDEVIAEAGGDLQDFDLFLCGPRSMIEEFTKQASASGMPAGRIHFEEFSLR